MKLLLTTIIILFSFQISFGQTAVKRYFKTAEVEKSLTKNYQPKPLIKNDKRSSSKSSSDSEIMTIPIIFHILYSDLTNKVSEAQVLSQLDALNRDFRNKAKREKNKVKANQKLDALAVDAEIEFCLANVSHIKSLSTPIHYVATNVKAFSSDQAVKFTNKGGTAAITPLEALNIWVCPMEKSVSGYAQMPGGPIETDGIVIDYRFFGTMGTATAPFDEGKTLTHLIGNYLNLHDIWGDRPCGDDQVADTPLHNAPNTGCSDYKHISLCNGNPVEMTMNFMDNTNDACMYMFTKGQKDRMHAVLREGGARENLIYGASHCKDFDPEEEDLLVLPSNINLRVFPNPASSFFQIELVSAEETNVFISISDGLGKVIQQFEQTIPNQKQIITINSKDWPEGVYFIHAKSNKNTISKTVVIQ